MNAPQVLLFRRVELLVTTHAKSLIRLRALQRSCAPGFEQNGCDRARQCEPHLRPVDVEDKRLGNAADGAHEAVYQSPMRDEALLCAQRPPAPHLKPLACKTLQSGGRRQV